MDNEFNAYDEDGMVSQCCNRCGTHLFRYDPDFVDEETDMQETCASCAIEEEDAQKAVHG